MYSGCSLSSECPVPLRKRKAERVGHLGSHIPRVLSEARANVVVPGKEKGWLRIVQVQRVGWSPVDPIQLMAVGQLLGTEAPVPRAKVGVIGLVPVETSPQDRTLLARILFRVPALRLRLMIVGREDGDGVPAVPVEPSIEQLTPQLRRLVLRQEAGLQPGPLERRVDGAILEQIPPGVASARDAVRTCNH